MSQQSVEVIRGVYDSSVGRRSGGAGQMTSNRVERSKNLFYADRNPYVGQQAILEGYSCGRTECWASPVNPEESGCRQSRCCSAHTPERITTGKEVRAQFAHVWGVRVEGGTLPTVHRYKAVADAVA